MDLPATWSITLGSAWVIGVPESGRRQSPSKFSSSKAEGGQEGITRKEWVNRQESNRQDSGWVWSGHEGWPSMPITETWEGRKVPPNKERTE